MALDLFWVLIIGPIIVGILLRDWSRQKLQKEYEKEAHEKVSKNFPKQLELSSLVFDDPEEVYRRLGRKVDLRGIINHERAVKELMELEGYEYLGSYSLKDKL